MHLSSPAVTNVNNGIFRDESSLTYITIDDAARMVAKYGRGVLMSKVDLKSAFHLIPVHPNDRRLFGCF